MFRQESKSQSFRSRRAKAFFACTLAALLSNAPVAVADSTYEVPPRLSAGEVLPDVPLKTATYEVDIRVNNDGVMNHFDIWSDYGPFFVTGDEMVRERLAELAAIEALKGMTGSEAYLEGVKQAGKGTLASAKTLITEPVKTLSNVPTGVARFFGNAYRSTKDDRRGQYQDSALKEALGFSDVKRGLAFQLGVDPYSSNQALQDALTDVAWADYAGGMSLKLVRAVAVPASVNSPVVIGEATVKASQLVRDESPESLQRINTEKLKELGASEQQIDALMTNGWYSPLRQTVLTEALYQLRAVSGIARYLERAVTAASEEEAFFMQRSAELLCAYEMKDGGVKELLMAGAFPVVETERGEVVLILAVDYLCWTARTDSAVTAIRKDLPARLASAPVQLWLGGRASETAASELGELGFEVKPNALQMLSDGPK